MKPDYSELSLDELKEKRKELSRVNRQFKRKLRMAVEIATDYDYATLKEMNEMTLDQVISKYTIRATRQEKMLNSVKNEIKKRGNK